MQTTESLVGMTRLAICLLLSFHQIHTAKLIWERLQAIPGRSTQWLSSISTRDRLPRVTISNSFYMKLNFLKN